LSKNNSRHVAAGRLLLHKAAKTNSSVIQPFYTVTFCMPVQGRQWSTRVK